MSNLRTLLLTAAVLALWSASAAAQDKKKGEPQAGSTKSIFKQGKPIDLTLDNEGKANYTGEIEKTDAVFQGHYYKLFMVKFEKGKTYRIEGLNAGDDPKFDPLLFLEDANGDRLAMDDDSAGGPNGLDARIVHRASKSGSFRIIATTAAPNQTGKFRLTVAPGTPEDVKYATILDDVANFSKLNAADQKKAAAETMKFLEAKKGKLTLSDAQLAMQFANATEDGDIELARSSYKGLIKIFGDAGPNIAPVTKQFEDSLKKLEMIGKAIVITGKTVDGKEFDLKNFKGKVVLVDFWATWCGPCVAEMPNIEKAFAKYHGKGFEVIGVSLDRNDEAITKFAEARKMKWGSINVEDSKVLADRYSVNAIPFPVLIDQAGNVISIRARGPQLDLLLERLLGEKK